MDRSRRTEHELIFTTWETRNSNLKIRMFLQHYYYNNLTGQSQESEGFYKLASIKEELVKLNSFQATTSYKESVKLIGIV